MATVNWNALEGSVLDGLFSAEGIDVDVGERYELREELGRGGQGTVYAAFDRHLNRQVAIKVAHDPKASRLLQAEAALLARLSHPAIPSVYDSGIGADGRAYMVMELVVGQPLYRLLRDPASLTHLARLRIIRAVAGAVAHAHQQGILHRDCKPANIMIREDGEPILIDWGLAATGDPRAICGTPSYAAPEQLSGQVADRRSDIFALGVLCYEVLSGKLPYARVVDDFEEFRRLRAGLGLIPLRKMCPHLPSSYQRVIDRAMAAQPAARFARSEDFCHALDDLIAGKTNAQGYRSAFSMLILLLFTCGIGLVAGYVSAQYSFQLQPIDETTERPDWSQLQNDHEDILSTQPIDSEVDDNQRPNDATHPQSPLEIGDEQTSELSPPQPDISDSSDLTIPHKPTLQDKNPAVISEAPSESQQDLLDLPQLDELFKELDQTPVPRLPPVEQPSGE